MSVNNSIDVVWNTYETTVECLKIVARNVHGKNISALGKSSFITENPEELSRKIDASTESASDYVILSLWAVFEPCLFSYLQEESRRMLSISKTQFTQCTQQKIQNELEYWRVDDVLDLFKSVLDSDLIGRAKQVKKYRDWVAHKNPRKSAPTNVPPQNAYKVLTDIVKKLEAHPEMQPSTPPV